MNVDLANIQIFDERAVSTRRLLKDNTTLESSRVSSLVRNAKRSKKKDVEEVC
jgi:hypothetical protein